MTATPRRALVVVDLQNMFVSAVGERGPQVVATVNGYVSDAVAAGGPVVFTRDYAPTELPAGDPDGVTDFPAGLDRAGTVVTKGPGKHGGFSGFVLAPPDAGPGHGGLSGLAEVLRASGVTSVVVAGIAADVCVAATARDARRLGYDVILPLDATAFVHAHPSGDEAALAELRAAGVAVVESLHRG